MLLPAGLNLLLLKALHENGEVDTCYVNIVVGAIQTSAQTQLYRFSIENLCVEYEEALRLKGVYGWDVGAPDVVLVVSEINRDLRRVSTEG